MTRTITLAVLLLTAAGPSFADDALYKEIVADPAGQKAIKKVLATLKKYYTNAIEAETANKSKKRQRASRNRDEAFRKFTEWLDESEKQVGRNLRTKPNTVIELLDHGRAPTLEGHAESKRRIHYLEGAGKGIGRGFGYATKVPKEYEPDGDIRYPLVISLHGRVINRNHPALTGRNANANERGRVAIHNNWRETPVAEKAIFIAPTGTPAGFKFDKDHSDDLQFLFRALGTGLTEYRADWNRVFLELHGSAIRVACEQSLVFAGFIVRDREDERTAPLVSPEEAFMLHNLNGVPLCYIADEKHWDNVGGPTAAMLEKAYEYHKAKANLLVLKGTRDINGALRPSDPAALEKFIETHRRPAVRKSFEWRFFRDTMKSPLPVDLSLANYSYDPKAPLAKKAGRIKFKASQGTYKHKNEKGEESDRPYNILELEITEAEHARVYLYEGLINFDFPVTLIVNGETKVDKEMVARDWNFFFEFIFPRRAFYMPYLGSVEAKFENKPEYTPAAPEEKEGAKEGEGEDAPAEGAEEKTEGDDASKDAAGAESTEGK